MPAQLAPADSATHPIRVSDQPGVRYLRHAYFASAEHSSSRAVTTGSMRAQLTMMFYGRREALTHVTARDPGNYFLVGSRQIGKSSLLKALQRRYADHPQVDCRLVVLSGDNALRKLGKEAGLTRANSVEAVEEAIRVQAASCGRRWLFLLDEADKFVGADAEAGYPVLDMLRSLSEEGVAHFILAGFWKLYRQAVSDYQSPLKNFGEPLELGALEVPACTKLATEPMALLNIRWASEALVQQLVQQTGQRANLISIACHELVLALQGRRRVIEAGDLQRVLDGQAIADALKGWDQLDGEQEALNRLARVVALSQAGTEGSFGRSQVEQGLAALDFQPDPLLLDQALDRLRLAFVFNEQRGEGKEHYRFQVPLLQASLAARAERHLQAELQFLNHGS